MKLFFLFIFSFFSMLNAMDLSYRNDYSAVTVKTTDSSFHMEFDLGLNENLLQETQDWVVGYIDDFINPYIQELQDLKEQNIKNLNYSRSPDSGASNMILSLFNINDGLFIEATKICKAEDTQSYCNFSDKSQFFTVSSINPFNSFREEVLANYDVIISNIESVEADFKNMVNEAWDKAFADLSIDGPLNDAVKLVYSDPLTNTLLEEIEDNKYLQNHKAESKAIQDLLSDPTKTPEMVALDYAKNTNNIYDTNKVGLEYGANVSPLDNDIPNNLCDLAMEMFDVNSNIQEKINERLSKLRKELYKYAVQLLIEELTNNLEQITIAQEISKATQCAIEATISVANASFDKYTGFSFANIDYSGITSKTQNPKGGESVSSDTSTIDLATSIAQKCTQEINDKNTKDTELQFQGGLTNYSTITVLYPTPIYMFNYSPWSNLALSGKGKTNAITNAMKVKTDYENCLTKAKSEAWLTAYQFCVNGNSQLEFKITSSIKSEVANLFNSVRKVKKKNCEMFDNAEKNDILLFSSIKTVFEQKPITPIYNMDGTWDYFGSVVSKLVQAKVNIPDDKSNQIALYYKELEKIKSEEPFEKKASDGTTIIKTRHFNNMGDFMNCGDLDPQTSAPWNCSWTSLSTKDNELNLKKVGLRNFCSYTAQEVIKPSNWAIILDNINSKNGKDTVIYPKRIHQLLSDLHHCSEILVKLKKEPIKKHSSTIVTDFDKATSVAAVDYLIDRQVLLKNKIITAQDYKRDVMSVDIATKNFNKLNEYDKFELCVNSQKKEDILHLSFLYKFCKEYKIDLFTKLFRDAKISFKEDLNLEKGTLPREIRKVREKISELQKKYKVQ